MSLESVIARYRAVARTLRETKGTTRDADFEEFLAAKKAQAIDDVLDAIEEDARQSPSSPSGPYMRKTLEYCVYHPEDEIEYSPQRGFYVCSICYRCVSND